MLTQRTRFYSHFRPLTGVHPVPSLPFSFLICTLRSWGFLRPYPALASIMSPFSAQREGRARSPCFFFLTLPSPPAQILGHKLSPHLWLLHHPVSKWILFIPGLGKRGRPMGEGVKKGEGGFHKDRQGPSLVVCLAGFHGGISLVCATVSGT